jgi:hypothetical protein
MKRSRNLRLAVIVFGIVIVLCSLAALAYSLWPLDLYLEQSPLAPTLFSPP